jgi:DNA-binding transcriptional LysR family regulator
MSYLVQLRTFIETYRVGSVSKAAANLGLSQPAASAHVQVLESAMGKPLFVRQARGVVPTAAAHDLASLVATPLDDVEAGLAVARGRTQSLSGTVHVAGPSEFLGECCARAFAELLSHGLQLRLHVGNQERIYALLASGEADLAITASTPRDRALGQQEIAREQFLLVAAPSLAQRFRGRALKASELKKLPFIAYDEELPLIRQYLRSVLRSELSAPAVAVVPDLRAVRGLAEAGAGWSVLPDYLCSAGLRQGRLVQLGPPGPVNPLYLVWSKSALRHPRVAFVRSSLLASGVG